VTLSSSIYTFQLDLQDRGNSRIIVQKCSTTAVMGNSFLAPIWNSLPDRIMTADSVTCFQNRLLKVDTFLAISILYLVYDNHKSSINFCTGSYKAKSVCTFRTRLEFPKYTSYYITPIHLGSGRMDIRAEINNSLHGLANQRVCPHRAQSNQIAAGQCTHQ
jgi:hypothetical protein